MSRHSQVTGIYCQKENIFPSPNFKNRNKRNEKELSLNTVTPNNRNVGLLIPHITGLNMLSMCPCIMLSCNFHTNLDFEIPKGYFHKIKKIGI